MKRPVFIEILILTDYYQDYKLPKFLAMPMRFLLKKSGLLFIRETVRAGSFQNVFLLGWLSVNSFIN